MFHHFPEVFLEDGVGHVHVAEIRLLVGNDPILVAHGARHCRQGVLARPVDFLHEAPEFLHFFGKGIGGKVQGKTKLCAASLDDGAVHPWIEVLGNQPQIGGDDNHQELPVIVQIQLRGGVEFGGGVEELGHLRPALLHRLKRGVDKDVRHLFVGEFFL